VVLLSEGTYSLVVDAELLAQVVFHWHYHMLLFENNAEYDRIMIRTE
jgi:hypothetical protein